MATGVDTSAVTWLLTCQTCREETIVPGGNYKMQQHEEPTECPYNPAHTLDPNIPVTVFSRMVFEKIAINVFHSADDEAQATRLLTAFNSCPALSVMLSQVDDNNDYVRARASLDALIGTVLQAGDDTKYKAVIPPTNV